MSWQVWIDLDKVFAHSPERGPGVIEVSRVMQKHVRELLHLILVILGPGGTAVDAEEALRVLIKEGLDQIVSGYREGEGTFSVTFKAALEAFAKRWFAQNRQRPNDVAPGAPESKRTTEMHLVVKPDYRAFAKETLTARERGVYQLYHEGMSEVEIAHTLQMSESSVSVRLIRADRKLRAAMEEYQHE